MARFADLSENELSFILQDKEVENKNIYIYIYIYNHKGNCHDSKIQ